MGEDETLSAGGAAPPAAPEEEMDHPKIDDENMVERYLLGGLESAEREAFEDHFLDCPRCLERLETARRLRDGLRTLAGEETLRLAVAAGAWARLRRLLPLALAAVVAVVALLLARQALERAESRTDAFESRIAALEDELVEASRPRPLPAAIELVATRSDEAPAMVLRREALAEWVVLEIALGPADGEARRGALRWRRGEQILWRGDVAELEGDTLRLSVRPATLEAGRHDIELLEDDRARDGRAEDGRAQDSRVVRRWSFDVR